MTLLLKVNAMLGKIELFCVLTCCLLIGCSLIGGKDTAPVAKLGAELEQARKDIDESRKEIKEVGGDVSMFEQRLTKIETTVNNVQIQMTQSIHYNESIKSIAWTVAGIYALLKILQFIRALIIAKYTPGSTLLNLVKGK